MKFEGQLSVNMSVGEIRVNKCEIWGTIQYTYVCQWNKGEIQVAIQYKYVCQWDKGE